MCWISSSWMLQSTSIPTWSLSFVSFDESGRDDEDEELTMCATDTTHHKHIREEVQYERTVDRHFHHVQVRSQHHRDVDFAISPL